MITIKDVVVYATFGLCLYTAWTVSGSMGRDAALQRAINGTKAVALNQPKAGEALYLKMDAALANGNCDLEINTYAQGPEETFPLAYQKHPKEFLGLIKNEKELIIPIRIPDTASAGKYNLMFYVNYSCNAIQKLTSKPQRLSDTPFVVRASYEK